MATKPAIVTKKQLEESGFDNLRDYLNAKRGLTRRDEQKFIGDKPKMGAYVPRDSDTRKGEIMTSKNAKPRDEYVRSGQKSFDTETEFVPPDMSKYKPRRDPEALTETNKPGTSTRYENTDTSDMAYKRGGSVKASKMGAVRTAKPSMSSASKRADGIATKGKTRGRMV
jgi:hypothetical protein